MSNDALERLKNRSRPTVKSRDASLISSSLDTSTSRHPDNEVSDSLDSQSSHVVEENADFRPSPQRKDTTTKKSEQGLKTKQSTLRLEIGISARLSQICQDNSISREVFLEALLEYYQATPEIWQSILTEAKKRAEYRLEIANRKRAQSMMKRFNP
jgi:hypothetical protein